MGIELVKNNDLLTLGAQRVRAVEEVWVGEEAPTEDKGYKIWVNPEENKLTELATKEYVDEKFENVDISDFDIDLTGYATEDYVNSAIETIELTPGPKGDKGEPGEKGADGVPGKDGADGYTPVKGVDYCTEEEKQALIEEILAQVPAGEALPAAEGVEF